MRGLTNKEFHKRFGKNISRRMGSVYKITFALATFMKLNRKKYTFKER